MEKLVKLGIGPYEYEVINTVLSTVDWITAECPDARVFAIAEQPLLDALGEAGVRMSEDPAETDAAALQSLAGRSGRADRGVGYCSP